MEEEKIARINHLAKKSRTVGLTDAEREEQAKLRAEYVAAFRNNLTATLERTYLVDEQGNKQKLRRKEKE